MPTSEVYDLLGNINSFWFYSTFTVFPNITRYGEQVYVCHDGNNTPNFDMMDRLAKDIAEILPKLEEKIGYKIKCPIILDNMREKINSGGFYDYEYDYIYLNCHHMVYDYEGSYKTYNVSGPMYYGAGEEKYWIALLTHELVHYKQCHEKRLIANLQKKRSFIWEGKDVEVDDFEQYNDLPWEKEANNTAVAIATSINYTGRNKKNPYKSLLTSYMKVFTVST